MKVCSKCGNVIEDNAMFCGKCGNRLEVQSQQSQYTYVPNQPQYQPTPMQQPPKKKNTGLIIGIVAAVVIVLAAIGSIAEKVFQKQGYGQPSGNYTPSDDYVDDDEYADNDDDTNDDSLTNDNPTGVKTYNKGSVVDGWYVNEWANLRVDTSGSWTDGSAEEYASYDGTANLECGVILNDKAAQKQLVICFEKLNGPSALLSEDGYLDAFVTDLKQTYANANLTCTASDYYDTTIAGQTCRTVKITFDGMSTVQVVHVRKQDGYVIIVPIVAQDSFGASSIANSIRSID